MQRLATVYAQLSTADVSLAVMSASCHEALGHEPWFRFPSWTWRVAEVGQDAADYQLLEFAGTALRQHPGGSIAVASGDGIFADLAIVAELEVVVPVGHNGVSHRLQHFLRARGSSGAAAAVPAARAPVIRRPPDGDPGCLVGTGTAVPVPPASVNRKSGMAREMRRRLVQPG